MTLICGKCVTWLCRWVELMAPVFSRSAWRCSWYMIQVNMSVWVQICSVWFICISQTGSRLQGFNAFVFNAERFDPCLGFGCTAWLLCSSQFLFLTSVCFTFLTGYNIPLLPRFLFNTILVVDRVIGRKMQVLLMRSTSFITVFPHQVGL